MGGLLRCVECGEVHWNLRLSSRGSTPHECRSCGSELKSTPRRFERLTAATRDAARPAERAGLGPSATS